MTLDASDALLLAARSRTALSKTSACGGGSATAVVDNGCRGVSGALLRAGGATEIAVAETKGGMGWEGGRVGWWR